MRLPPSKAIVVAESGAAAAFSVSSGAARAAPSLVGGKPPPPPPPRGGWGKGRIVVVEGDQAGDLTVGRLGHGQPRGVSFHVCRERWGRNGPLPPSG